MGTESEEELERRRQAIIGEQNRQQAAERAKELEEFRNAEELRKAAEAAAKGQNKMVADDPSVASWPADSVQETPGRLDGVKAALGIGAPGDAALAAKLLNSAHAPAGSTVPEQRTDGAKEQTAGVTGGRSTTAALGY